MPNASASYVISAVDQTKEAIRSIRDNFKSLEKGVKTTAGGINSALTVLAGVGLKNLYRNAMEAAAEASGKNSAFAKSLDDVKASAAALMVPKSGLPGVTESLQELAATLKDPAVMSAADSLFSGLIKYATEYLNLVAKGAAGWRILLTGAGGNEVIDLDNRILEMQKLLKGYDSDPRNTVAAKERARIQQDINELLRQEEQLRSGKTGMQSVTSGGEANANVLDIVDAQSKGLVAAQLAAEGYEQALKELADTSARLPGMTGETIEAQFNEQFNADLKQKTEAAEYYQKAWEEMRKQQHETEIRSAESRDADQKKAQDSIEAWRDVFFTGMDQGLDGLARKWKQTLKMMVAEALASGVFNWIKGGSFFGGVNSGFAKAGSSIAHLFGFANGGSILPGGSGGTDSQVVAFRKSPSERVDIYNPGQQRGSGGITVNIDARGATEDAITLLNRATPGIIASAVRASEARIVPGLRNGRYDS